jgi:hypothetical protein
MFTMNLVVTVKKSPAKHAKTRTINGLNISRSNNSSSNLNTTYDRFSQDQLARANTVSSSRARVKTLYIDIAPTIAPLNIGREWLNLIPLPSV